MKKIKIMKPMKKVIDTYVDVIRSGRNIGLCFPMEFKNQFLLPPEDALTVGNELVRIAKKILEDEENGT